MPPAEVNTRNHEPRASATNSDRTRRAQKMIQLMRAGAPEGFRTVGQYLIDEDGVSMLHCILQPLYRLPSASTQDVGEHSRPARQGIEDLLSYFRAVNSAIEASHPGQATLHSLQRAVLQVFADAWKPILAWLKDWLRKGLRSARRIGVFLFNSIFDFFSHEDLRDEITRQRPVIDFLFLLLCHMKADDLREQSRVPLTLYRLFEELLSKTETASLFAHHIENELNAGGRRNVILSIVDIAPEIVRRLGDRGATIASLSRAIEALQALLSSIQRLVVTDWMWDLFSLHQFIFKYSSALDSLISDATFLGDSVEPPTWEDLGEIVSTILKLSVCRSPCPPSDSLPKALKGGLLKTSFTCLIKIQDVDSETYLRIIEGTTDLLRYMPDPRVFRATKDMFDRKDMLKKLAERGVDSEEPLNIYNWFYNAYTTSGGAYYKKGLNEGVRMCSNKSETTRCDKISGSETLDVALKRCSACGSVAYCSVECQKADWERFHSRECSTLASEYKALKSSHRWTPFQVRNQLLDYLVYFASLSKTFLENPGVILAIDTYSYLYPMNSIIDVEACRELIWKEVNGVWDARVAEGFVEDMVRDPLYTRLIEGVFLHGQGKVLFVLAKARYDPTRKEGSLQILNAIFRYGSNGVVDRVWKQVGSPEKVAKPQFCLTRF